MRNAATAITIRLERELDLPPTTFGLGLIRLLEEEHDPVRALRRQLAHVRHLLELKRQRDKPPEPRPQGFGLSCLRFDLDC